MRSSKTRRTGTLCTLPAACLLVLVSSIPATGQLAVTDTDTGGLTPADLVDILLGPDSSATVSAVTLTGDPACAGAFTGGESLAFGSLGIDAGVVLSSGSAVDAVAPNASDSTTTGFGNPGDPFLDALAGVSTFDACILEFDFVCDGPDVISMEYVMGSEEYNEYVNGGVNDSFGFDLNGANIAEVPGSPGTAVSINTVNCGNPYAPPGGTNCALFVNNDLNDGGPFVDVEPDGLTAVFGAESPLLVGTNHIRLAIGDGGDGSLDSWVFLEGGSFQCAPLGGSNVPDGEQVGSMTTGILRQAIPTPAPGTPCTASVWSGKRSDGAGTWGMWAMQITNGTYVWNILPNERLAFQTDEWEFFERVDFTIPAWLGTTLYFQLNGYFGWESFDDVSLDCGAGNELENPSFELPPIPDGEWSPAFGNPPPEDWIRINGSGHFNPNTTQFNDF